MKGVEMRFVAGWLAFVAVVLTCPCSVARGEVTVRVGDVSKLKGHSVNRLVGTGLVIGLNGTGDGDQYEVTMRALAQALGNLGAPISGMEELKETSNVAIVMVDAVIAETGVREGDRIDVHVSALGNAKSLAGGRLLVTPLLYHEMTVESVFAFAAGPIDITDAANPTVGVVRQGALVREDVLMGFAAIGRTLPFGNDWVQPEETYITLVLDDSHAGWGLAVAIAEAVNAELSLAADVDRVAVAVDPKNVLVLVPPFQRGDPGSWIRDVQELSVLMPHEEARVTVNQSTGTIVVSGDARISPVVVSQKGMTVAVRLPPPPADEPRIENRAFVGLSTDETDAANVSDLLDALNQLQVTIEDRIAILTQMQRAGKLHAKLIFRE